MEFDQELTVELTVYPQHLLEFVADRLITRRRISVLPGVIALIASLGFDLQPGETRIVSPPEACQRAVELQAPGLALPGEEASSPGLRSRVGKALSCANGKIISQTLLQVFNKNRYRRYVLTAIRGAASLSAIFFFHLCALCAL